MGGAEPRWLTEEERRMWVRLVGLAILLPGTLETQLKRDSGLSFFDYHVLAMLSDAKGHSQLMSELALASNSSLSRLSHVITRLERQGWVRREASPTDGRATLAVLTDAGFAHLVKSAPGHVAEVQSLVFERLEDGDVQALSSALSRILSGMEAGRRLASNADASPD